jgi:hypothetical protein
MDILTEAKLDVCAYFSGDLRGRHKTRSCGILLRLCISLSYYGQHLSHINVMLETNYITQAMLQTINGVRYQPVLKFKCSISWTYNDTFLEVHH